MLEGLLRKCGLGKHLRVGLARYGWKLVREPMFLQRHPEYRFDQLFPCIATAVLGEREDVFFVQIGANDGVMADPLNELVRRHGWAGIAVEPQRDAFDALQRTYADLPQVHCENVAIDVTPGERQLFRVAGAEPGRTGSVVGSFERKQVLKWVPRGREDLIVSETVRCESFKSLLAKYRVDRVHLLVIDTEGYDFEILKTIDFTRYIIPVVLYEHCNLKRSDQDACLEYLSRFGYRFHVLDDFDTVAVRSW